MKTLINKHDCPSFIDGGTCYSCGKLICQNNNCPYFCKECQISKNDEHIPPKALFEQNKGFPNYNISSQDTRKVTSCYTCNNTCSEEDGYFLSIITLQAANYNNIAEHACNWKRLRGVTRDKIFKENFINNKKNISLYSLGNIYIDRVDCGIQIDINKFDKINIKIIKGFYFKLFNEVLFNQPKIRWHNFPFYKNDRMYTDTFNQKIKKFIKLFENNNQNIKTPCFYYENIQPNVFSYGYILDETTSIMMWYLNYYNCCKFFFEVKKNI